MRHLTSLVLSIFFLLPIYGLQAAKDQSSDRPPREGDGVIFTARVEVTNLQPKRVILTSDRSIDLQICNSKTDCRMVKNQSQFQAIADPGTQTRLFDLQGQPVVAIVKLYRGDPKKHATEVVAQVLSIEKEDIKPEINENKGLRASR